MPTLKITPIKDFVASKGFATIVPVIRENANGYPFITFIDAKNVAENIYFSKTSSAFLAAGQLIDKGFINQYQIGTTVNANGETRTKLVSNSNRVSLADLLD